MKTRAKHTILNKVPLPPCIPIGGDTSVTFPCWKATFHHRLHKRFEEYAGDFGHVDTFSEFVDYTFQFGRGGVEYWLQ